ncbi:unnamed protein product [Rotaria sordida]|uniref:Uncharacterized protein n=1 Tax=Rotaria sordida TaxID=392033 RepID=A0A815DT32_9BILA|nr:unnamed protein product [Rotaria sordida]CAF1302581.1 unnamed protein product [Rotaria sordida]CAF3732448.1 unnamed protein product [Rotaria sordida]CAF4020825.1 unnamed protein product [Rotaria sordida]
MSTGARICLVGSLVLTGATVLTVNYYTDEEKKRKRANIFADISRRDEQHRLNMEQYEKQLKIQEKLLLRDK